MIAPLSWAQFFLTQNECSSPRLKTTSNPVCPKTSYSDANNNAQAQARVELPWSPSSVHSSPIRTKLEQDGVELHEHQPNVFSKNVIMTHLLFGPKKSKKFFRQKIYLLSIHSKFWLVIITPFWWTDSFRNLKKGKIVKIYPCTHTNSCMGSLIFIQSLIQAHVICQLMVDR